MGKLTSGLSFLIRGAVVARPRVKHGAPISAPRPVRVTIYFWGAILGLLGPFANISAQPLQTLRVFSGTDGRQPSAPVLQAGDRRIFGTTFTGGVNNTGTIYSVLPDGTDFKVLRSFGSYIADADGRSPNAGLVLGSDGRLYGTAFYGGTNDSGTIFSLKQDGASFTTLYRFSRQADGNAPSHIMQGGDNRIYGVSNGGTEGSGLLFAINPDGTEFRVLWAFSGGDDGRGPKAVIQGRDGLLYGTTTSGALGNGTVFSIKPDGSGFKTIYSFTGVNDGATPQELIQGADGRLYAVTYRGGSANRGTIFSIKVDGSGFITLHSFAGGTRGQAPAARLLQGGDNRLYGVASGGQHAKGIVYSIGTDGSGFSVLHSFSGLTDGAEPRAALIQGADGRIYSTTLGDSEVPGSNGTVFALSVSPAAPPAITAQPVSQSAVAGSTAAFSVTASGTEPLAYQWRKDGAVINGATNATLTLNSVQSDQLGSYSVVVTNSLGSATSVSAVLSLTTNATYTFSTFAGSGTGGTADGTGRAAQFNAPWGIAVDAAGNVYVSEGGASGVPAAPSHVIRKITPAGVVSTLAGRAGVGGSQDGAGATATFSFPRGLTVDSGGTLYVAANGVRRISPAGVVSTLVASMNLPSALVFDLSGNLLVAESNVHAIKRVTLQGDVSGYAGTGSPGFLDGAAASAQFEGPSGIAADAFGNVYVSEYYNSTIRRITSAGSVSTFAGRARASGVADGVGADARFGGPLGLAVDIADALYVADYQNNLIRRISPDGSVVTIGGQAGDRKSVV